MQVIILRRRHLCFREEDKRETKERLKCEIKTLPLPFFYHAIYH